MPTIPENFIPEFTQGVEFQLQQKASKLEEYCTNIGSSTGEIRFLNNLEPTEVDETTGQRGQATKTRQLNADRRCITPREITGAIIMPRNDDLFLSSTSIPQSDALKNIIFAHNRKMDDFIVEGAFGINYKGPKGNEPVNIPNSQKLDITTGGGSQATSLNLAKILNLRQMLRENEALNEDALNSGDKLVMMVNASMLTSLLLEEKLTSSNYQRVQALIDGEINEALGIRFVQTERLPKDISGNPLALAFMRSGLAFSRWKEMETKIDELPAKNYDYQIWTQQLFGVTRRDEKKFVIVPCKNMPVVA